MNDTTPAQYDGLALFSGGLDSILAMKVMGDQGKRVLGLHFTSPFFGFPDKVAHWREIYELDIVDIDIGEEYTQMILAGPCHGFGKCLNPCVDCKVFMLQRAKAMLPRYGARFLISGEVVGQRPMSQRRDAMNLISKRADVRDVLVRPLCAQSIDPSPPELAGLVDRSRLLAICGRGRKDQLALAEHYALPEIPTPAGGCKLTEKESAKRYLPLLPHAQELHRRDFDLANVGRQFHQGGRWLIVGRNQADNEQMEALVRPEDHLIAIENFPGPLALVRSFADRPWSTAELREAAAMAASFSPRARKAAEPARMRITHGGESTIVEVTPRHDDAWSEPDFQRDKELRTLVATEED